MRRYSAASLLILVLIVTALISYSQESNDKEDDNSCPQKCIQSQKNCELSCSQIVGGGAKSRERRECIQSCGDELEPCNERCLNPTPKPTLKPERYHDKGCPDACEFKAKDCYQVCTKYTGGGAKSGDKARCQQVCRDGMANCKDWCVHPTPKPTLPPDPLEGKSCPEVCNIKEMDCETNCSTFIGGGAKSGKRAQCVNDCADSNDECLSECSVPE